MGMILLPPDGDCYLPTDDVYYNQKCFNVSISMNEEWEITIYGQELLGKYFSLEEKRHWMEVVVEKFNNESSTDSDLILIPDWLFKDIDINDRLEEKKEYEKKVKENEEIRLERRKERIVNCLSSGETVKSFRGKVIGPPEILTEIVHQYFSLYMYY